MGNASPPDEPVATARAGGGAALAAAPRATTLVLVLALFATRWTSYLCFHTLPLIIGALSDGFGLTAREAAFLATAELLALSLTGLVAAPLVAGRSHARTAAIGALLATLGHLLTGLLSGFGTLLVCRIMAGAGAGFLGAGANAALAAMSEPDKWFARIAFLGGIAAAILLGLLPQLSATFGPRSLFIALAAIMFMVVFAAAALPSGRSAKPRASSHGRLASRTTAIAIVAIGAFSIGQGMIWAFAERLAVSISIEPARLGMWFFAVSLVGLAGPALAAAIGTRFGRTVPIASSFVVLGVACLAFSFSNGEYIFGLTLLVYFAAAQFAFPFIFGLSAALDPLGRLVTVATTVVMLMSAAAPSIGALVLPHGGFPAIGWITFGSCVFAAILLTPVARTRDRLDRA